jgi:hypothetical protein
MRELARAFLFGLWALRFRSFHPIGGGNAEQRKRRLQRDLGRFDEG